MRLTHRRLLVAVLALALLAPGAALGKSLFRTGKYKGADEDGYLTVSFTAGKKNVKKLKFQLDHLPGKCTNGSTVSGNEEPYEISPASIGKRGRFRFTLTNTPQYVASKVTLRGKLRGSKVSGTFHLTLGPTPQGVTCDTGKLTWKGKHR
jgi:hypothetical protein